MYKAHSYLFPSDLGEAYGILSESKKSAVIGGGLWMRMTKKGYGTLIDLSKLGLDRITANEEEVSIGAMATLRDLETSPVLRGLFGGALGDSVSSIVGVQMRNAATVGGTVYSCFGFSDPLTVLLALDAEAEFFGLGRVSVSELIKMKRPRDVLIAVHIKNDGRIASFQSIRQTKTDFAVVNLAAARLPDGSFRVAVGARPGPAALCPDAGAYLSEGNAEEATRAVKRMTFGTNMRGSKEYRREMAALLLSKAYEDLGGEAR